MTQHLEAIALGVAAGVLTGLFGVGGGILFVPTLTLLLGLGQLSAQATSLAAMIPAVLLGAWRQGRNGNVDWRAASIVGIASAGGVAIGAPVAKALPEDVLHKLFAVMVLVVAARLLWTLRAGGRSRPGAPGDSA